MACDNRLMVAESGTTNAGPPHSRAVDHIAMAVGTTKGLFILNDGRVDGPFFPGDRVPAFADLPDRYLAATVNGESGSSVRASGDGGLEWSDPGTTSIAFPDDVDASLGPIWQLHVDRRGNGAVWAGVEPAALYRSPDGVAAFELVRGLWDHPDRPKWEAGCGGGPGLHSIRTHPDRPERLLAAISAGGVYRSDDGGTTWQARNKGIEASPVTGAGGGSGQELGPCVHKIAIDAGDPDWLWAQDHGGIYRSEDAGDTWENVGHTGAPGGVPSDFGFPIVAHPRWPGTAYVFPLESASFRCSAHGRCRVYRTTDAGGSWEALTDGLPQSDAYVSVLRDAFTVGDEDPHVLVFGTSSGDVYASVDDGDSWRQACRHLPPILNVRVLS